ncbi:MAG: DnaJ domain-containing protein, partial [Bacteroidia bacterium]|nr:DnaJ domain-containing protein [Bacteroidia bacterium]
MKKEYYQDLELDETATTEDIRKAYRRLAKKFHPDKNTGEEAHSKFVAIAEANEVLSNSAKRAAYDRQRKGLGSDDALQRMAEAFARAQELARERAEIEYQKRVREAEERYLQELKWTQFADVSAWIGIILGLLLALDFFGASWSDPVPILQKRLFGGTHFYLLVTAEDAFKVESSSARAVSTGWDIQHKQTFLLQEILELRASPPYDKRISLQMPARVGLYRPFFFFPTIAILFA